MSFKKEYPNVCKYLGCNFVDFESINDLSSNEIDPLIQNIFCRIVYQSRRKVILEKERDGFAGTLCVLSSLSDKCIDSSVQDVIDHRIACINDWDEKCQRAQFQIDALHILLAYLHATYKFDANSEYYKSIEWFLKMFNINLNRVFTDDEIVNKIKAIDEFEEINNKRIKECIEKMKNLQE